MLDNYLLIRDFEVNDLNKLHKSRMIEKFIKDRIETKDTSQGYNTEYYDEAYTSIISKKFLDIVHEEFNVSEKLNPIQTWIYVQNNKFFCDNLDLKTTPEGLSKKFDVYLLGRKSKKAPSSNKKK